jgi:hypothetical protein
MGNLESLAASSTLVVSEAEGRRQKESSSEAESSNFTPLAFRLEVESTETTVGRPRLRRDDSPGVVWNSVGTRPAPKISCQDAMNG